MLRLSIKIDIKYNCINILIYIVMSKRKRDDYIRASSVSNYILNDKLVDYLQINKVDKNISRDYIMEQGNIFEEELLKIIKDKHTVVSISNIYDTKENKFNETKKLIAENNNIIYQGYLYDQDNNIGGSPDLLVKSTYINKLMNNIIILENEQKINDKDYYVVIDIKHSNINYDTFNYIKNDNRIPAYKSQLYVYTKILNQLQGININKAYIWAKSYNKDNTDFLNNLGIIDYDTIDKNSIDDTNKAIRWLKNLYSDYDNIVIENELELYPNMKSNTFIKDKNEINKNINDITTIWNCSVKKRKIAHDNNIYSWKDEKLTAELLGFKNNKAMIINNILDINRQEEYKIKIINKIDDNIIHSNNLIIYLDFEGFTNNLQSKIKAGVITTSEYYIYMIGIGYMSNDKWCYKSFILDKLDQMKQIQLFQSLFYYLRTLLRSMKKNKINFYHWSNYEKTHFNKIKENIKLCLTDDVYEFTDLCKIFQNSVVIKDAFNFKLKTISKALYNHSLIDTHYDDTNQCANGLDASILALESYDTNNMIIMKDIEKYNEIDCKLLHSLHYLLQKLSI
jgi:hypothetical protein